MTTPYRTGPDETGPRRWNDGGQDASVGQLVGEISEDLSTLFRQEIELAKAELRGEASKAGKAAGAFSGAGLAGYLVVVLLTFALVFALGNVMDLGWAALLVAVLWAIAGTALFLWGRSKARRLAPVPRRTVDTLKEDAKWLKHPTR